MKNELLRQQLNWKDAGRLAVVIRRDRCGRILEILNKIEFQKKKNIEINDTAYKTINSIFNVEMCCQHYHSVYHAIHKYG